MFGLRALLFAVACGLFSFGSAAAATADNREVQARTDFAAGRYQQAIETFAQLYGETMDPVFLRNIARCHQKLGHAGDAIETFRDYLRKAKSLSAGERAEIDGFINEMETLKASQAAPAPADPPGVAVIPPVAATDTPAPPPAPPPDAATSAMSSPASGGGSRWRTAGIVTSVAGVALIGAGIAWGISARHASSDVSAQYDPSRAAEGERNEILSFVGYGAGAAAIVAGIMFYARGMNRPPAMAATGVRARPLLGGNCAGLIVGGEF